jgi:hypothetical protein
VLAAGKSEKGEVKFKERITEDTNGFVHLPALKPRSQLKVNVVMVELLYTTFLSTPLWGRR